jgi:hypothetical protein
VAVVVVVTGAAAGRPFETWSVTVEPFGSREPPPGICEATTPRGCFAGPTIALTL